MPGYKGQSVVLACKIRHLNLGPAKHEEVAIYAVNMRIPNVYRIVRVRSTEQFVGINQGLKVKMSFTADTAQKSRSDW